MYIYRRRKNAYDYIDDAVIRLVGRGYDPWTVGEANELRRENENVTFPFENENPDGITGSHTGGIAWWKDGTISTGGSAFPDGRFGKPPPEFFKGAKMAQGCSQGLFAVTGGGNVLGWDLREKKLSQFPDLTGIVEMEAGHQHGVFRSADGSVAVRDFRGTKGHERAFPPDELPIAVSVRAGHHMSAIRKLDGTWLAWGPNPALVDAVKKAGKATDLDIVGNSDKGYVIWIEPVDP